MSNAHASALRYCPERALPPYAYVPGQTPHPLSDPRGHSYGQHPLGTPALTDADFAQNQTYRYALDLFNQGYYWEAHEAWESLWHAAGRTGVTADFLKGLIKLAAAGVKATEGRPLGITRHATSAAGLFLFVGKTVGDLYGGLSLSRLESAAQEIAREAARLAASDSPPATPRLPLTLTLTAND
jgi:hypothetical protein